MIARPLLSVFTLTLAIAGLFPTIPVLAQQKAPPPPPPPPEQPPPRNQPRPGGGLDPERLACQSPDRSLIALVPEENPVYTTSPYPTLLFYIPDRAKDVRKAELILNTPEAKTIGIITVQLPDRPGIISVRLPERLENALAEGQDYHWLFKLHCPVKDSEEPITIAVWGWIQRLPRTAERESAANNAPEKNYDAIAAIAQQRLAAPEDPIIRERWFKLLQILKAEELLELPLFGDVAVEQEQQESPLNSQPITN